MKDRKKYHLRILLLYVYEHIIRLVTGIIDRYGRAFWWIHRWSFSWEIIHGQIAGGKERDCSHEPDSLGTHYRDVYSYIFDRY